MKPLVFGVSFLLTGCGIGGMWMTGNPFPDTPKPYLEYWEKEAVSEQERRDDSKNCGGQASDISPMRNYDEESYQLDGETIWDTRKRLASNWQRCMIEKGYLFKGACYDNEISRESPACEGRVLTPIQQ